MTEGQNSDVVRTFWEQVFGECRLDIADAVLAEGCVLKSADDPGKRVETVTALRRLSNCCMGLECLHVTV